MKDLSRISIRVESQVKERFDSLNSEFPKASQQDIVKYLLSLEDSRQVTSLILLEQRIKQWLFLGYNEEITMHKLRKACETATVVDGKLKILTIGLPTVRKVFALYESEINKHNAALTK